MPASVVSITGNRQGTYVLLEAVLPGEAPRHIGIILIDPATDRGWVKLRGRYDFAAPEDAEVLEAVEADLRDKLAEMGAEACLQSLEDSLSNVLRVGERQAVAVDAFSRVCTANTSSRSPSRGSRRTCPSTACARRPAAWARKWNRWKKTGCPRQRMSG